MDSLGPAGLMPLVVLFGLNMVDEFDQVAFGALAPEIRNHFNLSNAIVHPRRVAVRRAVDPRRGTARLLRRPVQPRPHRADRRLVWALAALGTGLAPFIGRARSPRGSSAASDGSSTSRCTRACSPTTTRRSRCRTVFGVHRFANILGNIAGPIAGVIALVVRVERDRRVASGVHPPRDPDVPLPVLLAAPEGAARAARRSTPRSAAKADRAVQVRRGVPAAASAIHSLKRTWVAAFFFGAGVIPLASFLSLFFEDIYGMGPVGRGIDGHAPRRRRRRRPRDRRARHAQAPGRGPARPAPDRRRA